MGSSDSFSVSWNTFQENMTDAFRQMREDKDFFDVTLVCDDDQIQAHKVILSACSPFFHTILRRNKHEHPLIFLLGVKYIDILSVLDFMYHGEVTVAQENLNSFLAVSQDLKVKGLTQISTDRILLGSDQPNPKQREYPAALDGDTSLPVDLEHFLDPTDFKDTTGEDDELTVRGLGCEVAKKHRSKDQGLACDTCHQVLSTEKCLKRHMKIHEGVRYYCDLCEKSFARKYVLVVHVKSKHTK